jgi:hypothetical protein
MFSSFRFIIVLLRGSRSEAFAYFDQLQTTSTPLDSAGLFGSVWLCDRTLSFTVSLRKEG